VGPYEVGTFDTVTTGSDGESLTMQVWFPVPEAGTDLHLYGDLLSGTAWDGGTPECSIQRPVLVFSHGNTSFRFQSIFFTERLASHGWVVVAPDHRYNTFADSDTDKFAEVVLRRPQDVADAFDFLLGESDLTDCVDSGAGYAVAGHSFGGYTSLAVTGATLDVASLVAYCEVNDDEWCVAVDEWTAENPGVDAADLSDPRAWAGVPMTPGGYYLLNDGVGEIDAPILLWGGEDDTTTTMEDEIIPAWESLTTTPRALAVLADAGHFTFSDICLILPTFEECSEPFIDMDLAHEIINAGTIAWLEVLRGEERAADYLPPKDEHLSWESVK